MAQVAVRFIFWKAVLGADSVEIGKQICVGTVPSALVPVDNPGLLAQLKAVRGFARLGIRDQSLFL